MAGPVAVIDGPEASAPVHSLLKCMLAPAQVPARWERGFLFRPDNCLVISTWDPHCPDPNALKTGAGDNQEWEPYFPFMAETVYQCDSTGWTEADDGAALRQLEASTPKALGFEFWTGALMPANRHLADPTADDVTPSPGTAASSRDAIGLLIQALADCGGGGRGMIHATPRVVNTWAGENFLEIEGGCLVTTVGRHVVIPDPGYPGTAPDGSDPDVGESWAYATSMVQGLVGPAQVLRPDAGGLITATVGGAHGVVNAKEVRAERSVAAWWGCCHAAVLSQV